MSLAFLLNKCANCFNASKAALNRAFTVIPCKGGGSDWVKNSTGAAVVFNSFIPRRGWSEMNYADAKRSRDV